MRSSRWGVRRGGGESVQFFSAHPIFRKRALENPTLWYRRKKKTVTSNGGGFHTNSSFGAKAGSLPRKRGGANSNTVTRKSPPMHQGSSAGEPL